MCVRHTLSCWHRFSQSLLINIQIVDDKRMESVDFWSWSLKSSSTFGILSLKPYWHDEDSIFVQWVSNVTQKSLMMRGEPYWFWSGDQESRSILARRVWNLVGMIQTTGFTPSCSDFIHKLLMVRKGILSM